MDEERYLHLSGIHCILRRMTLSHRQFISNRTQTLISQQSEQIDKIEDDVEAASLDVQAGQNSITEVYSLKKGNRPLILRVFAILIFVIIFMRFYRG